MWIFGYRRQGIANRLFDATFAAALLKGYEKVFTFVRADNPAALQTYLRQGFQTVGTARRQARIDGRYVDEIIIEKIIDEKFKIMNSLDEESNNARLLP